jgi:hypothetical protein
VKHYVNPTMMAQAIKHAGGVIVSKPQGFFNRFPINGLARIQWTGPWTAEGANPKWRYRQTHWVASWLLDGWVCIFDVNAGLIAQKDWESTTVPWIVKNCVPRADGGWYITHAWEVQRAEATSRLKEEGQGRGEEGVGNHAGEDAARVGAVQEPGG